MPGYWCLFEAFELSLLRSKSPTWFGLYSAPKAFAILLLLTGSFLTLRFISPIISSKLDDIPVKERLKNLSPLKIFFFLLIIFRISLINIPCSVGEDMTQQMLSSKQWLDGISIAPNVLSSPDSTNISANKSDWIVRPPGGAWIPLPWLLLGFSLGNSIHISLSRLKHCFWDRLVKISQYSFAPHTLAKSACFLLAVAACLGSLSLSTASVFTTATFPWLLTLSLYFSDQWNLPKQKLKIHLLSLLFFSPLEFMLFSNCRAC